MIAYQPKNRSVAKQNVAKRIKCAFLQRFLFSGFPAGISPYLS